MTRLIVLFVIVVAIFLTQSHGRTIMLDEEQVETSTGKTIILYTVDLLNNLKEKDINEN